MNPRFIELSSISTRDMEMLRGDSLDATLTFRKQITDPITGDVTYTLADFTDCTAVFLVEDIAGNVILTLTSAAGQLVMGGSSGTIAFAVLDTTTLAPGDYRYQLRATHTPTGKITAQLWPALFRIVEDVR